MEEKEKPTEENKKGLFDIDPDTIPDEKENKSWWWPFEEKYTTTMSPKEKMKEMQKQYQENINKRAVAQNKFNREEAEKLDKERQKMLDKQFDKHNSWTSRFFRTLGTRKGGKKKTNKRKTNKKRKTIKKRKTNKKRKTKYRR